VAPSPGSHGGSASGHEHSSQDAPVLHENHHSPRPPETKEGGAATIWLHRTLPDPTPPAMRLDPRFKALSDGLGLTDYWRRRGIGPDAFLFKA